MTEPPKNRRPSFTFSEKLFFFAGILFCLVLITTAMVGGLFARYTTSDSGRDEARAAAFGSLTLTETGDFDGTKYKKGKIVPGVPLIKNATVTFTGSEMATAVFAEVIVPQGTWETTDNRAFSYGGLSWSVASGWAYLDSDQYRGNNRYIFYKMLAPNTELNGEPIVTDGKIYVDENITKTDIAGLANAALSFRASVIQTGGFQNVGEAWAALAAK